LHHNIQSTETQSPAHHAKAVKADLAGDVGDREAACPASSQSKIKMPLLS